MCEALEIAVENSVCLELEERASFFECGFEELDKRILPGPNPS